MNIVKRKLRGTNENMQTMPSDSGERSASSKGHLPGGTLLKLQGISATMINADKSRSGELRNWTSFRIERGKESTHMMSTCRIPDSTAEGMLKSKAQCD